MMNIVVGIEIYTFTSLILTVVFLFRSPSLLSLIISICIVRLLESTSLFDLYRNSITGGTRRNGSYT